MTLSTKSKCSVIYQDDIYEKILTIYKYEITDTAYIVGDTSQMFLKRVLNLVTIYSSLKIKFSL